MHAHKYECIKIIQVKVLCGYYSRPPLHYYSRALFAGPTYNEDGDIVISEDEFNEIKRLKELKHNYRNDYDELKNLKAEVQYCQRLVDQCRQRLIQGGGWK